MIEYRKAQKVVVAADVGFALQMLQDYVRNRRGDRRAVSTER